MNNILILVFGVILGILFSLLLFYLKFNKRVRSGPDFNETDAEDILKRNGFKIISRRKSAPLIIYIDGKSHLLEVYADYIAEKENKQYAVVAARSQNSDPQAPALSRHLLEVKNAFPSFNLLFLNPDAGTLSEIGFEFPGDSRKTFFTTAFILFIIAVALAAVGFFILLKLF